jgi:hypothetical protein
MNRRRDTERWKDKGQGNQETRRFDCLVSPSPIGGNLDESDGVYSAPDMFVVAVVIRTEPAVNWATRFQVSE